MSGSDQLSGLDAIELRPALQQPGCPVCHARHRSASRYIDSLLWENVNDVTTRVLFIRSLGFCPEHTWQAHRSEIERFGDEMGLSIIYEDLTRHVIARLYGLEAEMSANAVRRSGSAGSFLRNLLRVALGRPSRLSLGRIEPQEECRVCHFARQGEERAIRALAQAVCQPDFRALYVASDGLCLPHLRRAIGETAKDHGEVAHFLVADAVERLSRLRSDLHEYTRKRSWQYHHEALTGDQLNAAARASQFFAGCDRCQGRTEPQ